MLSLIQQLKANTASIWLSDEKLKLSYADQPLEPELLNLLKTQKNEIIAFLKEHNIFSQRDFNQKNFTSSSGLSFNTGLSSNTKGDIEAIYPATSLQQGFIFHQLSQEDDDAYRSQSLLDYTRGLDVAIWQQAWRLVSARYPILRAAFDWQGDILQVIYSAPSIDKSHFTEKDISDLPSEQRDQAIIDIAKQDRTQGYDLSKPGLIRFTLIKQSPSLTTALISVHHSILDGWSGPLLLHCVHQYYDQLMAGVHPKVNAESTYLLAQDFYREQKSATEQYWEKEKKGFGAANDITSLLSRRASADQLKVNARQCVEPLVIGGETYQNIKTMCQQLGVTLNAAVQFSWHKLLQTYSGDEKTTVGATVSGRDIPVPGIESSVGFYINTLPLSVHWNEQDTIATVMHQIQEQVAQLNTHSNISLSELQGGSERLFHSLCVFENFPSYEHAENVRVESDSQDKVTIESSVRVRPSADNKSDYPIVLVAYEQADSQLMLRLIYDGRWMDISQVQRILEQLRQLLVDMADDPQRPQQSLTFVSQEERNTLLNTWNQTAMDFGKEASIQELFEQQVRLTPDAFALCYDFEQWTYNELNEEANQLAHVIRKNYQQRFDCELSQDTFIGLYFDRSMEMLVSILAVLKAGGAYVPISPDYPESRSQFILNDTQCPLLLTQKKYHSKLGTWNPQLDHFPEILCADDDYLIAKASVENPEPISHSRDLAYMIYTSGTTGIPKGVMIEQHSVINHLFGLRDRFGEVFNGRVDFSTNYCFDLSVTTYLFPLLKGGCVHIYNDDISNIDAYNAHLRDNQIHFVKTTPSIGGLIDCAPHKLDAVLLGGERLTEQCVAHLTNSAKHIFNEYGPTEATIGTTGCKVQAPDHVHIGKPFANVTLYVLNSRLEPVPIGAPGELYIGGQGVARAYYKRDDNNAKRFIRNPFKQASSDKNDHSLINGVPDNARLYKTGDMVRWLPSGEIDFIGRNDSQVKINGYRIELGEIERAILHFPGVAQVAVLEHEQAANKFLAAYVVMEKDSQTEPGVFTEFLAQRLPRYMIPSTFSLLEALPITVNGKLDRRALVQNEISQEDNYLAPRDALEQKLCQLWQQVLGVGRIGVRDNFYALGGNSISAIRLTAEMRKQLNMDVSLSEFLDRLTVESLASYKNESGFTEIDAKHYQRYPLSFAQERLLFVERFEQGCSAYHIPYLVKLDEHVKLDQVAEAFNLVIARHPVIRSVYRCDESGQEYVESLTGEVPIQSHTLTSEDELLNSVRIESTKPFDLSQEFSIRLNSYECGGDRYLLILWHHIAFDGWSIDVFINEFASVYQALCRGQRPDLPESCIQYGDYALWQRHYLQGENLNKLTHFWQQQLSGYDPLVLPYDHVRPSRVNYQGRDVRFVLDQALSQQLRDLAKAEQCSLYTILLSGFYLMLSVLSGQRDIVLGSPSDNRHHAQTQNLIGFFINSIVLRVKLNPEFTVHRFIQHVHEVVTEAKAHQDLPFEKLIELLKVIRTPSSHSIYQVKFGVQSFGGEASRQAKLPFQVCRRIGDESIYSPAKYDLSVFINDGQNTLSGSFNYALSLFEPGTIDRMTALYKQALHALVCECDKPLKALDFMLPKERELVLDKWQRTGCDFSQHFPRHNETKPGLAQLFEMQVEKMPDAFALSCNFDEWTYEELNEEANQLAHVIRAQYASLAGRELTADTLIGLYFDRSIEMIVSILAILKAGAAYVPISPSYPQERTAFIVQDSLFSKGKCAFLITTKQHVTRLNNWLGELPNQTHLLVSDDKNVLKGAPTENLEPISQENDLAYVIYTSGTTGKPKGVMLEQGSVANHLFGLEERFGAIFKRVDFSTNYCFDLSVTTYLFPLLRGGCVCVYTDDIVNIENYNQHLSIQKVDFVKTTPSIAQLIDCRPHMLESVLVGGEPLTEECIQAVTLTSRQLLNEYGPTEAAIGSTGVKVCSPTQTHIGRAFANVSLFVLSEQGQPVPIGVPGELYIGGVGVARGYINRPELTQERFITNPFATDEQRKTGCDRLYKTGDIVRWRPDGNLVFLRRNDGQIKLNGYRIELSEIEHAFLRVPEVKQVVVVSKAKETSTSLVACVVLQPDVDANEQDHSQSLREKLLTYLPSYMVPSSVRILKEIPLTANGKVDRRMVADLAVVSEKQHQAPHTVLEQQVCELWQQVVGVASIGVLDDFFQIGGNSMMAVRLIHKMNERFGSTLSVANLFSHPTVASLSQALLQQKKGDGAGGLGLLQNLTPNDSTLNKLTARGEDKPILFMVHPGGAGCEPYYKLAAALADRYTCIGIDNFNLVGEAKTGSLCALSKRYVEAVVSAFPDLVDVNLLAWSMGGNIALEMAYQIEQQSGKRVRVCLLDTIIKTPDIREVLAKRDLEQVKQRATRTLLEEGMSQDYIDNLIRCREYELEISRCELSGPLEDTDIVLLKAGRFNPKAQINAGDDEPAVFKLIKNVPDNNLSAFVKNNIDVITVADCHHVDLLQAVEVIRNALAGLLIEVLEEA